MKTRTILHLFSAVALAVGSVAVLSGTEAGAGTKVDGSPATPAASPARKDVLDKGTPAAEIVKLYGKPYSVTNLKMEGGKAEKWIYRKLLNEATTQDATTVINEPAFVGPGAGSGTSMMGTRPVEQFSMKHTLTYQMTALLMIDDHLVLARQWKEDQVSYDQ